MTSLLIIIGLLLWSIGGVSLALGDWLYRMSAHISPPWLSWTLTKLAEGPLWWLLAVGHRLMWGPPDDWN